MDLKDIVGIVSSVVTLLATILAGGWAYYRFVKGRVFKPRLTLTASARRFRANGTEYVLSTIELSNVGLSKIDIHGADLRVCSLSGKAVPERVTVPQRHWLRTRRVLLAHSWVESGEVLREQNLLTLPLDLGVPILVDIKVVARGVSFKATSVAVPLDADMSSTDEGN